MFDWATIAHVKGAAGVNVNVMGMGEQRLPVRTDRVASPAISSLAMAQLISSAGGP